MPKGANSPRWWSESPSISGVSYRYGVSLVGLDTKASVRVVVQRALASATGRHSKVLVSKPEHTKRRAQFHTHSICLSESVCISTSAPPCLSRHRHEETTSPTAVVSIPAGPTTKKNPANGKTQTMRCLRSLSTLCYAI